MHNIIRLDSQKLNKKSDIAQLKVETLREERPDAQCQKRKLSPHATQKEPKKKRINGRQSRVTEFQETCGQFPTTEFA